MKYHVYWKFVVDEVVEADSVLRAIWLAAYNLNLYQKFADEVVVDEAVPQSSCCERPPLGDICPETNTGLCSYCREHCTFEWLAE